jgi:short-subunit dehydrogenase
MFNNAGIACMGEALDYDWAAWKDIIDTDLLGVVHGIAACYPIMVSQKRGHIVNTASLAALMPTPWAASYTAAKAGVWGLTIALRVEAKAHGVKVSCVCPASVSTPLVDTARFINLDRAKAYAAVPGSRITADECALAILKGMERNQAVIAPSAAKWMSRLYRYAPNLTEKVMVSVSSKLGAVRTEYLKLQPESTGGTR